MNADELRKEFEKKSGLLEVGLDVMYRPDDGRIPYFRDAYVEHLESLVLSQAEQIEIIKAKYDKEIEIYNDLFSKRNDRVIAQDNRISILEGVMRKAIDEFIVIGENHGIYVADIVNELEQALDNEPLEHTSCEGCTNIHDPDDSITACSRCGSNYSLWTDGGKK